MSAISGLDVLRFWSEELARERHRDPRRLVRYGRKVYSQNDEDGILAEIFARIGAPNRTFVEFGVEHGVECNTLWLLVQGWSGFWIEADEKSCRSILQSHRHWLDSGALRLGYSRVTAENIDELIERGLGGRECDLLSIDIDSNDYWIWKAITGARPRVVAIEYNATWPPPAALTVPYRPEASWSGSNYFGASLAALGRLGEEKGYKLVGCSFAGANAFFVREDLCGDHFLAPGSVEEHYEPPRYFFSQLPSGHRPGIGPLVEV